MRRRRYLRLLRWAAFILLALVLAPVCALRRTLPAAEERRTLAGLHAIVAIDYDSLGVPTVRATNDHDLAFAEGYAHARDRRFQMELIRRNAAGRLSEVFGRRALPLDREKRRLGYAAVVDSAARLLTPAQREHLEAYAAGINAWDSHHPAPPEFLALGIPREPWRVQDCLLVLASMFDDLQLSGESETMVEVLDASLPSELVDFLLPESTPLDVTLDGLPAPPPPPTPSAARVNLRSGLAAREGSRPAELAARAP